MPSLINLLLAARKHVEHQNHRNQYTNHGEDETALLFASRKLVVLSLYQLLVTFLDVVLGIDHMLVNHVEVDLLAIHQILHILKHV